MARSNDGPNLDDLAGFSQTVPAGEFVFREGDSGHDLFIVQDGQVELLTTAAGARVALFDPGGIFGEWSFFESQPREASARAVSEARLLRVDRDTFDRITGEAPQIAIAMLQQLARRVRAQGVALEDATGQAAAPVVKPPAERGDPRLVESESRTEFVLGTDDATVGRPDRSTGFVPEVDLSALDVKRTLSRRHARVVRRDDTFFVREEAGTRNGTFVNGQRVATGDEIALHDGDLVQFGFVKTVFQWR